MTQSTSQFRPVLNQALEFALDHLDGLDERPVAATATLDQLRARLRKPLNAQGLAPEQVIEELVRDTKDGVLGSAGGRFFAWVIGGSLPAALAADWLTSAWDQNAAIYACGPSAAIVEEVVGEWLKELLVGIGSLPGVEVVREPGINQGLVRFLDPGPAPSVADHDACTEAVIGRILSGGEAFFGPTTWRGIRCMRISVCNWQTSERDVQRAIIAVQSALE